MAKITTHRQLKAYQLAFEAAMKLFELSKSFPRDEIYSLTDQARRSSRSVCANLTEAWRKRRYEAAFISKLSDAETEAAETQTWLEFAVACEYLDRVAARQLYKAYDEVISMIIGMIRNPNPWLLVRAR